MIFMTSLVAFISLLILGEYALALAPLGMMAVSIVAASHTKESNDGNS